MFDILTSTAIQLFVGIVVGISMTMFTLSKQKKIKKIAYIASGIRLFKLHDKTPESIQVTIDKSVLTGKDDDAGKIEKIDSAYAHSVSLKNKGNVEINEAYFNILFEQEMSILSFTITPEPSKGYKLDVSKPKDSENLIQVFCPYLNINQEIKITAIATGNKSSDKPIVSGIGKGIEVYEFKKSFPVISIVIGIILLLTFSVFTDGISMDSVLLTYIKTPIAWVELLGGNVVEVTRQNASFSLASKIIAGTLLLLPASYLSIRAFKKNTF